MTDARDLLERAYRKRIRPDSKDAPAAQRQCVDARRAFRRLDRLVREREHHGPAGWWR